MFFKKNMVDGGHIFGIVGAYCGIVIDVIYFGGTP